MATEQSAWAAWSREIAEGIAAAAAAVVSVQGRHRGGCCGFLWDERTVVTSAHAVSSDATVRVIGEDGAATAAQLIGRDPGTDIAVLRLEQPGTAAPRSGTVELAAGHWTVAVSRLTSGRIAATAGLISEVGPEWKTWRGGTIDRMIRLDGTVPPWFCGAPLLDSGGVLGLCTTALTRGRAALVPLSTIDRVARQLNEKGHVSRAYVGVALQGIELSARMAKQLALDSPRGALVVSVQDDAPAERAGLLVGDVVVALGGKPVHDAGDVRDVLSDTSPGDTVVASLVRAGERREIAVVAAERPGRGC